VGSVNTFAATSTIGVLMAPLARIYDPI
jgi:hypothetical protein